MTSDTLQWVVGIGLLVVFLLVMMRGCGGMGCGMGGRRGAGGCGMGHGQERDGRREHEDHAAATTYTCPMHPEVKQDKPGTCPKCGMALVPQK